ncbi:MAG: F0F1 ATP synthase subunit A [Candidatus Doudnabacteria bacterium]|nr:F0F1 ATP synthase subunit A [Candidatus Doudnabacteria bacterium]
MLALPPLAAEEIIIINNFSVTNTFINAGLTVIGFAVFAFLINLGVRKYYKAGKAPKGLLNFFEGTLEMLLGYFDQVTHSRAKSIKFLPLVGTLFFFIVVSNWIGLLPGIGSIGIHKFVHGQLELVPLFRPANTDLNMTLAMAVVAVVTSHVLGVAAIGFFKYANKFIKLGDIYHAVKSFNPVKILTAIVEFFVGLIEIFSEVAKVVSLSLRLFGNVFAGEVLLTVIGSLIAYFVPLPFIALEIIVGVVQATVFSMLTLVYLTIATTEIHEHDSHGKETEDLQATPTA